MLTVLRCGGASGSGGVLINRKLAATSHLGGKRVKIVKDGMSSVEWDWGLNIAFSAEIELHYWWDYFILCLFHSVIIESRMSWHFGRPLGHAAFDFPLRLYKQNNSIL